MFERVYRIIDSVDAYCALSTTVPVMHSGITACRQAVACGERAGEELRREARVASADMI